MAYTNAIFYLDYENGNDAARTTLTTVTVANPSGSITRCTKTGHGLVTGAVVTLSNFTAWLNGAWKITVVDANNFDLDGAVWQATADASGDVVPFGGMSWTDAWKTITRGGSAARIAPGDVIRIAKSSAPSSIGTATWTNLSKTVTLSSAQNATIDNCETAWTAANSATVTRNAMATDGKEGSFSMQVTAPASPATTTKYAYYAISTTDFSAYQKITFWIKNEVALSEGNWKICLCSDNAGASIVDEFQVPEIASTLSWLPLTITKNGGGNLGASIQSIALYSNTVAPTASKYLRFDNFSAATTSGLNLQSLISKNSAEQGGDEAWYGLQSINGTTLLLDWNTATKSTEGNGYFGTTESITTYKRETIKTALASTQSTNVQEIMDSGTLAGGFIEYQGGYNTSNSTQDGETIFDGLNGYGYGIYALNKNYYKTNKLSCYRYYGGVRINGQYLDLNFTCIMNCAQGFDFASSSVPSVGNIVNIDHLSNNRIPVSTDYCRSVFTIKTMNNTRTGFNASSFTNNIVNITSACNHLFYSATISGINNTFRIGSIKYALDSGIIFTSGPNYLIGTTFSNNTVGDIKLNSGSVVDQSVLHCRGCSLGSTTKVTYGKTGLGSIMFSQNNDAGAYNKIYTDGGLITTLDTTLSGGTGIMWKLETTDTTRNSLYPIKLSIAKIAVTENNLVTVKVWMQKGSATNIRGKLVCRGGQLAGVPSDVVATKADDTNWEELTITFTPTEVGVIEIEAYAEYVSTASSYIYIDGMTITQA